MKLLLTLVMGVLTLLGWLLVVAVLASYFALRGAWLVLEITVHSFRLNSATPLPDAVRPGLGSRHYLLGPAFRDLAGVLADVARLTARWMLGTPAVPGRYRPPDRHHHQHQHQHHHQQREDRDDRPAVFRPPEGSWLADAAGWGGEDGLLIPMPFLLLHLAQAIGLTVGVGAAALAVLTAVALTAAVLAVAAVAAGVVTLVGGDARAGRQPQLPPSVARARTLMAWLALGCLGLVLGTGVLALLHLVGVPR